MMISMKTWIETTSIYKYQDYLKQIYDDEYDDDCTIFPLSPSLITLTITIITTTIINEYDQYSFCIILGTPINQTA